MPDILTSSEVILKAQGRQPMGAPSPKGGRCALCGKPIAKGDMANPLSLTAGFVDDLSMAARGSDLVCGCCPPFLPAEGLRESGYGAFSLKEGFLPFRKWGDIASVLENPPTPPFVLLRATANNQHMAWRAPVNYSRDVFYVRIGLRDVKIRHSALKQAVDDALALGEAINAYFLLKNPALKSSPAKKTLPNPFVSMDPDIKSVEHGAIHPVAYIVADRDPQLKTRLDRLLSITTGESWALRFLLTPGAGQDSGSEND